MHELNFPKYRFNIKEEGQIRYIFDSIRKKFIKLTPEEWVRQNILSFLIKDKNYPQSLISVEHSLSINNLQKRCDILIFDKNANPIMIVECKAPHIKIAQKTFNQILVYDIKFQTPFLIVTNGLQHFCCKMNYLTNTHVFLPEIPEYAILLNEIK